MSKVISQFVCKICNKQYASYQSLWIHNKKFHKLNSSSKNISSSSQPKLDSKTVSTNNSNIMCEYCNCLFSRKDNLKRHYTICKFKSTTNNTVNNLANNTINNNIVNTNSNNINSNNTTNNTIIINKLGNENVLHLTKTEVMTIFNKELESITTMIELLNFNERLPENHSFCTTNLESNYMSIYNPDKQTVEKDRKKYMFDKILDNSIDKIQLLYNHYRSKFDTKRRKRQKIKNKVFYFLPFMLKKAKLFLTKTN